MAAFVQRIRDGKPENTGVRGAESTLTAILGRMAMDRRREVTWDEMMKGLRREELDMSNLSRRAVVHAAALVPFQAVRGSAQNSAIKLGLDRSR